MKKLISLLLTAALLITTAVSFAASGTAASYIYGDVDSDGKITAKDSLLLRRYIAGLDAVICEEAADINADGKINSGDALLLKQHLARIITIDDSPVTDTYLSDILIFGVSLSEYTVIVPADGGVFPQYAAELLCDYVEDKSGIKMEIKDDTAPVGSYEFLIGETNRSESAEAAAAVNLTSDEYLLKADGYKVVMLGDSYMIGGGVGKFTYDYITYDAEKTGEVCSVNNLPTTDTPYSYEARSANNVILMIGDGMGPNHATASLYYNTMKKVEPDYTEFSAQRLPYSGQLITASLTTIQSGGTTPTDSAAGGTALSCGIKTLNSYMGINQSGAAVQNIRELAVSLGKKTGVMSTELKEGATPATFTIHWSDRHDYDIIASLQDEITDIDYLKGDINDDLLAETKYELDLLSTNNDAGFFTMIEEANIDTWSHQNDISTMTHCMARFNTAIQYAMVFAVSHPDTLLIITADHETGGVTAKAKFTTSSHTTANVPIYSIGYGSERLVGTAENTTVPKVIASVWGVSGFGE